MPFQSEKQRRYLWANEPEIARDWTDTYGSRIDKNSGGIARLGLFDGSEINKGIAELEGTPINYLNANQVIPKSGISNLTSGYDPAFGELETWDSWNTGYPSGYFTKHSDYDWEGEHPQMIRYDEPGRFELSEEEVEEEPAGLNMNLLPNDFNRDYRFEDANWRTRLKNQGRSGIDKAKAFRDFMLMVGGKAIDMPLNMLNFRNPLSPRSSNYNPRLQGQVDYLGGALGTRSSPYQFRSGKGSSVLAGKNLVSGFGTNDYGQMLQKRIDYFENFKKKRALTIAQNKKLQDAIAEKKAADAAAAARTRPYAPDVGSGGGQSGISRGTSAAQASGMGGGSRQATSAGATSSGRTDSGWGW